MTHDHKITMMLIGAVMMIVCGKSGALWMGRYGVYVTGRIFGHGWHGFPSVHRIKQVTWTRECITGEKIEVFGGGIRVEDIRYKSKLTCCNVCGKTISEEPIGKFIYDSRGEKRMLA